MILVILGTKIMATVHPKTIIILWQPFRPSRQSSRKNLVEKNGHWFPAAMVSALAGKNVTISTYQIVNYEINVPGKFVMNPANKSPFRRIDPKHKWCVTMLVDQFFISMFVPHKPYNWILLQVLHPLLNHHFPRNIFSCM